MLVSLIATLTTGPARSADAPAVPDVLHACESEEGYPPFAFRGRDGKPAGYSVDLVNEALDGSGIRLDVTFMPPRRCSTAAEEGGQDMVMEDNWSSNLGERFLVSDSIYDATMVLIYDRNRYPRGLTAEEITGDPQHFPGCGILGEHYAGLDPGQIALEVHRYANAYAVLESGRCSFFPEMLEHAEVYRFEGQPIIGGARFGSVTIDLPPRPNLLLTYDPGTKDPLFLFVRRGYGFARPLVLRLNKVVERWRKSGEEARVMARYLGGAY
jgi:hypothetical protein